MSEEIRDRILAHLENERYGQAQYQLRLLLREDERDAPTRSLLALCLSELEQYDEAEQQAERALQIEPDLPFCSWVLGVVLADRRQFRKAMPHAQRVVALEPESADGHALLARCHIGLGNWQEAIAAADGGLAVEPDDLGCLNLRAMALQHTARHAESEQAFVDAGSIDPDHSFARAGRGWAALHANEPASALSHFYHALQLDPHSVWAREGLIAALKSRNPFYRLMLRYFLWMDRLTPRVRLFVLFGGAFLYNRLADVVRDQPALGPYIYPLLVLYALFVLLTWTADPLFDFLLRRDPAGRALVTRERRLASNAVVGLLAVALSAAVFALSTESGTAFLLAFVCGVLVIPVAGTFQCSAGWPRTVMTVYTAILAVCGAAGLLLPAGPGAALLVVCILGSILSSWLMVWLRSVVPAR